MLSIARLIGLKPDKHILKWLHILTGQSPNRRQIFITLILETEIYKINPPGDFDINMLRFQQQILKKNFADYLTLLFKSFIKGINFDYVFEGFLLAQKYRPKYKFDLPVYNCTDLSAATVEKIHAYLKDALDYVPYDLLSMWEKCGEYPGLSQIINRIEITDYNPETLWELLKIYLFSCNGDTDKLAKWEIISQLSENELIDNVPNDLLFNYLEILGHALYYWKPDEVVELLPYFKRLLLRLCLPTFNTTIQATNVILSLLDLVGPKLREDFITAPDSSFLHLVKACRSKNNANLIDWGVWSILYGCNEYLGELDSLWIALLIIRKNYSRLPRHLALF